LQPSERVYSSPVARFVGYCTAFHVIMVLFVISFSRTVMSTAKEEMWWKNTERWSNKNLFSGLLNAHDVTWLQEKMINPNAVLTPKDIERLRLMLVVERKQTQILEIRFCHKCRVFKPDRCHHCRKCETCVLRMDHHCPWIDNCIGFRNYKFFFLTLVYGSVATCFVLVLMHPRFLLAFQYWDAVKFFCLDIHVFTTYILSGFVFCLLVPFLLFHIYLMTGCLTTIEWKEKKIAGGEVLLLTDILKRHRWKISNSKFNHGWYANLCHSLGSPWMWLLPSHPGGDGTFANYNPSPSATRMRWGAL